MKTLQSNSPAPLLLKTKSLTLGDLIASTYSACGAPRASRLLQLALDAQIVRFK
jgi:hypothetical protein